MMCRCVRLVLLIALFLVGFPFRSPAPLIYRPGEGWSYEAVGSEGKWQRARAKDQLEVAQQAFDAKKYGLALKAARRVVRVWPVSDYAPQAQYLVARCYEAKGRSDKAFKEYQKLVEKNPKGGDFRDVIQRQYDIANLYLGGKWFKLWGVIPAFPSMDKTADMYAAVVKNGPFSDVAPQAQLKIGTAREKQHNYVLAVKAYELAADRYHDRPEIAAEALYRQARAYRKQAQTADYDQTTAGQAVATYTDFMTLFPNDPRANEAQKTVSALKSEQARGNYRTAKFYEKYHKWEGAMIYYNEVLLQDPSSPYATEAKQRIAELKKKTKSGS